MSTTAPTTAKISWVDGALFVAEGGSGHTLTMDGSPDVGGRNLASRPMEVVLMGMGGCTAIDVVSMLKKQRQDIEGRRGLAGRRTGRRPPQGLHLGEARLHRPRPQTEQGAGRTGGQPVGREILLGHGHGAKVGRHHP